MPRGDGTGPAGLGPMTGRAAGYCAGYPVPGFMNPFGGRGMGMAWGRGGVGGRAMAWRRGWGRGPGWGRGYACGPVVPGPFAAPPLSREDEIDWLQQQASWLKDQLAQIDARISELEKKEG